MRLLRNILTILVILAMIGIGVLFSLQNKTAVPLDLLIYSFEPRSLALWILAAFALGGIIGMLISSAIMVRLRASLASSRRQLEKSHTEVAKLRDATPVADVS